MHIQAVVHLETTKCKWRCEARVSLLCDLVWAMDGEQIEVLENSPHLLQMWHEG